MPIELQDFANGDTNYVEKLVANNAVLEAAINALQTQVAAATTAAGGSNTVGQAVFGIGVNTIGQTAWGVSGVGTVATVAPGFLWSGGVQKMYRNPAATTLNFSGYAAGTYYVAPDSTGAPVISTSSSQAAYSVVWTGSAFGTITKVAGLAQGYDDFSAALVSAALAATYTSLDARLEGGENAQTAEVSKSLAASNVTLTDAEAMQAISLKVTGVLPANRDLIVPTRKKPYIIHNIATGAFQVTVKTAAGTGIAFDTGVNAMVYCDGTNVVLVTEISGGGGGAFTSLSDAPGSYSGQANKVVTVKADESGLEFSAAAAPSDFVGLSDVPASYTGEAGKVVKVNGTEDGLEFADEAGDAFTSLSDAPSDYAGNAFRVVSVNGAEDGLEFTTAATPASLLGLVDTPDSYDGFGNFLVRVKADESGLEFTDEVETGSDFLGLTDTPDDYVGQAGRTVVVNGAESGLEYGDLAPSSFTGLTDAPSDYTGQAFRLVMVSGDESGLEFTEAATPTSFVGLIDTPDDYTGDGSKAVRVKADESGLEFAADPYDVGGAYNGVPAADAVIVRYPFPREVVFPASLTGSQGVAETAATAQTDFDILKNGSSVGTMRFAAAGTVATFIMASATTFVAGDILKVVAPAAPDATLADIGFALAGVKS